MSDDAESGAPPPQVREEDGIANSDSKEGSGESGAMEAAARHVRGGGKREEEEEEEQQQQQHLQQQQQQQEEEGAVRPSMEGGEGEEEEEEEEEYEELPVTHGENVTFRRRKFQAHAAPVRSVDDVQFVVESMFGLEPWCRSFYRPFAFRIAGQAAYVPPEDLEGVKHDDDHSGSGDESGHGDEDGGLQEGYNDGGETGAGEKLLLLLQRWDVQNVVLIMSIWEDGLPNTLRGERFKIITDRAKAVLEQCYQDAVAAGEADAPPALHVDDEGEEGKMDGDRPSFEGKDLVALRDGRLAAPAPMRVFASDSVPWPTGHDNLNLQGGIAVGAKRGRIAHFSDDIRAGAAVKGPRQVLPELPVQHIAQMRAAYGSAAAILGYLQPPWFTREVLSEVKALRKPPQLLHDVVACVGVLIGWDSAVRPEEMGWPDCRDMLADPDFCHYCSAVDLTSLHPHVMGPLASMLADTKYDPARIRVMNEPVGMMLEWLRDVIYRYFLVLRAVNPDLAPPLPPTLSPEGAVMSATLELGDNVQYLGYKKPRPPVPTMQLIKPRRRRKPRRTRGRTPASSIAGAGGSGASTTTGVSPATYGMRQMGRGSMGRTGGGALMVSGVGKAPSALSSPAGAGGAGGAGASRTRSSSRSGTGSASSRRGSRGQGRGRRRGRTNGRAPGRAGFGNGDGGGGGGGGGGGPQPWAKK